MPELTDAELIERCLRGEESAWEQIIVRFRRKVFHIAYKFTGKHDKAEDLSQEIFMQIFKSLEKFNRDADFSTWLSSVARNYCLDHYRARLVLNPAVMGILVGNPGLELVLDHGLLRVTRPDELTDEPTLLTLIALASRVARSAKAADVT